MKPRLDATDEVEWWLANNYGPHVNQRAWDWIQELRDEIASLTPLGADAEQQEPLGDDEPAPLNPSR